MAAEKKKVYGNMRIMAIEGKDLYRTEAITALKNGKLNPDRFGGIIDESLDTDKLCEVYKAHEAEIGYPYLAEKKYCRAIVSVSFDLAVKLFEQYGRRFVRYGYTVTDADMQDHICVREVDGEPMLVAIEIPYENDKDYAPVENPLSPELLEKYFEYDAEKKEYKRSKKDIPSSVKCEEIREHLYTHGFDIDGIHYVRYKRSAGSSRDGRCLFIAEPLYQDMMTWSSCGLSADSVSDQASWQAYIALTLSSIESAIRLPKKAILIIPDNGGKLPEFFRFITEGEAPETDESVTLNTPMSFLYDIVEGYKSQVKKTRKIPLMDLFELDASDSAANDTHKKQNIIKIVSEAEKAIRILMLKAQSAEDDDKVIFMEKAQEIFERCLSAVNKNVVNDHILCLLLKELDKKKDSAVSRCRNLLFACLVYEEGRRLLSKVKGARDYIYPELVFWNDDPGEAWNLITENILGYLHVIIDNSQNTDQLKEKFYPK